MTQAEFSRALSISSPKYRVMTLDPRENPIPRRRAFGYWLWMKARALRVSSVAPAEYSFWLVIGTPAPRGLSQTCESSQTVLTTAVVDHNSSITQTSLRYRRASASKDSSNIGLIGTLIGAVSSCLKRCVAIDTPPVNPC